MMKSLKQTVFLTALVILGTEIKVSRVLLAADYSYPSVDHSDIDDMGLPCYMQTEEGSTLDLSSVCTKPPRSQEDAASNEATSDPYRMNGSFYQERYSPDPYSNSEVPSEDYLRY